MDKIRDDVRALLVKYTDEISSEIKLIETLSDGIAKGHYQRAYIDREVKPKLWKARETVERKKWAALEEVNDTLEAYLREARKVDLLNPDDMTEDCKLLNAGITLSKADLRGILNRCPENRTMAQIVIRYAQAHGIDLGMSYTPYSTGAESLARGLRNVAELYVEHWIDQSSGKEFLDRAIG